MVWLGERWVTQKSEWVWVHRHWERSWGDGGGEATVASTAATGGTGNGDVAWTGAVGVSASPSRAVASTGGKGRGDVDSTAGEGDGGEKGGGDGAGGGGEGGGGGGAGGGGGGGGTVAEAVGRARAVGWRLI